MKRILLNYDWSLPQNPQNHFAAPRKHDIHTGIDLFAPVGTEVYSIQEGVVIDVGYFTGKEVGMPWWNTTQYVMIETNGFVCNYGEISPLVKIGDIVKPGDLIGTVQQVLKKDKGLPQSMLHFELYSGNPNGWAIWNLGEDRPEKLLSPTKLIENLYSQC